MTAGEFEKQYKNFIEKHPYGAMLAQIEGIDRKIFEGLVESKINDQSGLKKMALIKLLNIKNI